MLDGLLERLSYIGFDFADQEGYGKLGEALDGLEGEGHPLNRAFYLSTAPEYFGTITTALKEAGLNYRTGARHAGGHREALRHRPRVRARAAEDGRGGVPRAAGLPHRPLPGQGDRPERDGVPVRELHVRAGLEPQLHRPHPDHRRRGPRDRLAGRLLRPLGRAARPRPEPHAPAADARVHGAAGHVRGRQGARREGQGAGGDHAADARGGGLDDRARAVHGGRVRRRAGRRATSRRTTSRATPTRRPTPRCAWRSTTGAGRACRSCCAPASGSRAR